MTDKRPALLIFDCDGVLVDSERLAHEVLCEMLAEVGIFDLAGGLRPLHGFVDREMPGGPA